MKFNTVTDKNGFFSLDYISNKKTDTIVFQALGYHIVKKALTEDIFYAVRLEPDTIYTEMVDIYDPITLLQQVVKLFNKNYDQRAITYTADFYKREYTFPYDSSQKTHQYDYTVGGELKIYDTDEFWTKTKVEITGICTTGLYSPDIFLTNVLYYGAFMYDISEKGQIERYINKKQIKNYFFSYEGRTKINAELYHIVKVKNKTLIELDLDKEHKNNSNHIFYINATDYGILYYLCYLENSTDENKTLRYEKKDGKYYFKEYNESFIINNESKPKYSKEVIPNIHNKLETDYRIIQNQVKVKKYQLSLDATEIINKEQTPYLFSDMKQMEHLIMGSCE
jgi:hypothetical protein